MPVCLSVCLSLHPLPLSRPCWAVFSLHACLCLSVCLSVPPAPIPLSRPCWPVCPTARLSLSVCVSVCLSPLPLSRPWPVCPPACPFLSVCLSVHPHPLISSLLAWLSSCMPVSVCLSLRASATPLSRPCWPAALQIPVSVCLSVCPSDPFPLFHPCWYVCSPARLSLHPPPLVSSLLEYHECKLKSSLMTSQSYVKVLCSEASNNIMSE